MSIEEKLKELKERQIHYNSIAGKYNVLAIKYIDIDPIKSNEFKEEFELNRTLAKKARQEWQDLKYPVIKIK